MTLEEALEEVRSRISFRVRAKEIAEKSNLSNGHLSNVLHGRSVPSIQCMEQLGFDVIFIKREETK